MCLLLLTLVTAFPINAALKGIHAAVVAADFDQVARLAVKRANLEQKAGTLAGFTPLHLAVLLARGSGDTAMVSLLLGRGAPVNAQDDFGRTPLHVVLDAKPVRPRMKAADLGSFGESTSSTNRLRLVRLLVDRGADMDTKDKAGATPLNYAFELADGESIAFLRSKGCSTEGVSVWSAVRFGDRELVGQLLAVGADANEAGPEPERWTALHFAVDVGDSNLVAMLLAARADVNRMGFAKATTQGRSGERWWFAQTTALDLAILKQHAEIAEMLRGAGAKQESTLPKPPPAPEGSPRQRSRRPSRQQEQWESRLVPYTTDQLRLKLALLNEELKRGWYGEGVGMFIARGFYEAKVRERDAIAMEILRRVGEVPRGDKQVPTPPRGRGFGTGFFVSADGLVATAHHVIAGAQFIEISSDKTNLLARVVAVDPTNDLALLKVEGRHTALRVVASQTVALGTDVFTLGFPDPKEMGISPKFTDGTVSSLAGLADDPSRFQISVPIQPGNSGGPLMTRSDGTVVGIIVAMRNFNRTIREGGFLPQNVNYAVKSNALLALIANVPGLLLESLPPGTPTSFQDIVSAAEDATVQIIVY